MTKPARVKTNTQILTGWENAGVECYYVRFHQPVPPAKNLEPVAEFCLTGLTQKYLVDQITYTPHGVIFRAKGEVDLVPLANIIYARSVA